jgi:hypothetical protein
MNAVRAADYSGENRALKARFIVISASPEPMEDSMRVVVTTTIDDLKIKSKKEKPDDSWGERLCVRTCVEKDKRFRNMKPDVLRVGQMQFPASGCLYAIGLAFGEQYVTVESDGRTCSEPVAAVALGNPLVARALRAAARAST